MKSKYLAIIIVVAFIVVTVASKLEAAVKISVTQTAEKITISGYKGKKITSDNSRSAMMGGISLRFRTRALMPVFASYHLLPRK